MCWISLMHFLISCFSLHICFLNLTAMYWSAFADVFRGIFYAFSWFAITGHRSLNWHIFTSKSQRGLVFTWMWQSLKTLLWSLEKQIQHFTVESMLDLKRGDGCQDRESNPCTRTHKGRSHKLQRTYPCLPEFLCLRCWHVYTLSTDQSRGQR